MYNERKAKGTTTLIGIMALNIVIQSIGFCAITSAIDKMPNTLKTDTNNIAVTYIEKNLPAETENVPKVEKIVKSNANIKIETPISTETLDVPTCNTEFKTYMDYRCITDKTSAQYELQQFAWTDEDGFRRIGDDYIVAMGTYYAENVGDRFKITLDTDNEITVIIGDIKQDVHTDYFNQYTPIYDENGIFFSGNVLEFIVDIDVLPKKPRRLGTVSYFDNLKGNIKSIERIETEE